MRRIPFPSFYFVAETPGLPIIKNYQWKITNYLPTVYLNFTDKEASEAKKNFNQQHSSLTNTAKQHYL